MMYLTYAVFALYLIMIIGGGAAAIAAGSLVRALLGLIAALFGVAGMYLLMSAPFLALMQLLIYVGAVGVLIFFAIMLTKGVDRGEDTTPLNRRRLGLAAVAALLPSAGLLGLIVTREWPEVGKLPEVEIARLGETLLGPYVLVFELISVVLFIAMAGAVLLGFERRKPR